LFARLAEPSAATGGIGVAFTDRSGGVTPGIMGSLNLGRTDVDDPANVLANFQLVGERLGQGRFATTSQTHTADVATVDGDWAAALTATSFLGSSWPGQPRLPFADALVTAQPGVVLAMRVADCLPILLADPQTGVIAAVHAGRPGLFAGIVAKAVQVMRGLGATRIDALIGPHVCGRCYEVPGEMVDALSPVLPQTRSTTSWGTPSLDLAAGARAQLAALGCRVEVLPGCTRTDQSLHSHRRDGAGAGRLAGLIWRR